MPGPLPSREGPPPSGTRGPALMPCLLLRKGQVCLPGPEGPVVAPGPGGRPFDPFDVVDRLAKDYSMLYVVDLDGIEHQEPQLDYLQEISRDLSLWVDGGVRNADQAIDILVAGAHRAVLSSAYLQGPRQLRRAWRLSTELVFELEIVGGHLAPADPGWETRDPMEIARIVRETGPDHLIVSPREDDPEWELVAKVAAGGPTWVDGSFHPRDLPRLAEAHAVGGIFHLDELLTRWNDAAGPEADATTSTSTARDDEN